MTRLQTLSQQFLDHRADGTALSPARQFLGGNTHHTTHITCAGGTNLCNNLSEFGAQLLVSIAVGRKCKVEHLDELYAGLRLACERHGVDLVGGDTTSSLTGMADSISGVRPITDLPVTMLRQIPAFTYTSHVYSSDPAKRFIKLNGRQQRLLRVTCHQRLSASASLRASQRVGHTYYL